jgi:hypothetical protein
MEDPSQLPSKPPIGFGSMDQPHQGNYQWQGANSSDSNI